MNENSLVRKFDILLVGHLTKDRIITGDRESQRVGGAVYYGAFPLKMLGVNVGVVTKLARRDHHLLEEFRQQHIPVFAKESRETTQITIIRLTEDGERRKFVVGSLADPFYIEDFVDVSAEIINICPLMKGEMPVEVIKHLSKRARLGLDAQGFIRVRNGDTLRSSDWDEKKEGLSYVHYLKTDQREAERLTEMKDMRQAAEALSSLGPREVIVTNKEGILLYANGQFYSASFDTQNLGGRIGRGDTCMASYLGRRLTHSPEEACRFAAAVVSTKLKNPGPFKGDLSSEEAIRKTLHSYL